LGSEDCLYLNIWTPDPGGNCPVVHWLFGGGCERGSASPPYSDGEELMRGANVVVVTSNYRLGALGFLHLGQSAEERWKHAVSVGRLDQVAALDWIQNNIGLFGGDPRNITVAGESAAPSR
jgi:para-nitrobenzyl esterase